MHVICCRIALQCYAGVPTIYEPSQLYRICITDQGHGQYTVCKYYFNGYFIDKIKL